MSLGAEINVAGFENRADAVGVEDDLVAMALRMRPVRAQDGPRVVDVAFNGVTRANIQPTAR